MFQNAGRSNIEWICLHFKAIFLRLSGAKSREINAEMQAKTLKLRFRHFRNTLYSSAYAPSVTLRVPASSCREPFGVRMRLTGSRSGPLTEGVAGRQARLREFIGDAEL